MAESLGERVAQMVSCDAWDKLDTELPAAVLQVVARIVDAECWPKPDPSANTSHAMRAALRVQDIIGESGLAFTPGLELRIATAIDHEYKHAR